MTKEESPEIANRECPEFKVYGVTIQYQHCPYTYPCGSAPCEKGDECPAKVAGVKVIPWPYIPPTGPSDWPPTIFYSQSCAYMSVTNKTAGTKED